MTHAIAHFLKSSLLACTVCTVVLWLTGCSTPPQRPPQTMAPPPAPAPAPVKPAAPIALPSAPVKPQLPTSNARTAKEYRLDAAKHLYKLNGARIFKGRMPPMLYAVGVLDVEVDKQGQVTRTYWVRAPGHSPSSTLSSPCPHGQGGLLRRLALAQERSFSARHPDRGARLKI
ncbi:MAG: hypothetical protein RL298_1862 [Pseudomonadota bacterium]